MWHGGGNLYTVPLYLAAIFILVEYIGVHWLLNQAKYKFMGRQTKDTRQLTLTVFTDDLNFIVSASLLCIKRSLLLRIRAYAWTKQ